MNFPMYIHMYQNIYRSYTNIFIYLCLWCMKMYVPIYVDIDKLSRNRTFGKPSPLLSF